ncbi:mCG146085, partial [Mus musculus]
QPCSLMNILEYVDTDGRSGHSLLTWDSAMSALSSASSSSCCTLRNLDSLQLILQLPDPGLQLLQLLLAALEGDLLCLVQTVLQVLDGLLHVLLHALQVVIGTDSIIQLDLSVLRIRKMSGLIAAACLRIQGGLQGVHHPQVVALGLLHLLILLCQLPFDLCLDLVELQLGAEDLALLVLQGGLERI